MAGLPSSTAPRGAAVIIPTQNITGVVLSGGMGTRMGGVDKGLQLFRDTPLALHALRRLQLQVGQCCISANRHLQDYASFGLPVLPDASPDFPGPLAGLAAALRHCETPYLVTVPCDVPLFPDDLVTRLAAALAHAHAQVAVAEACEPDTQGVLHWRKQPTFCLVHTSVLPSLEQFLAAGGRKVGLWLAQQHAVAARFEDAGDAFANANTPAELQALLVLGMSSPMEAP